VSCAQKSIEYSGADIPGRAREKDVHGEGAYSIANAAARDDRCP
jgi:hypothetical protein